MNHLQDAAVALAAVAAAAAIAMFLPRTAEAGEVAADTPPMVGSDMHTGPLQGPQLRGDVEWYQPLRTTPSAAGLTPAQARDEYKTSRDQVNAFTGEDSGSKYLKLHPSGNPTATMGGPAAGSEPATRALPAPLSADEKTIVN